MGLGHNSTFAPGGARRPLTGRVLGVNYRDAFLMRPVESMAMVILYQIRNVSHRAGRRCDGGQSGLGAGLDDGEVAGLRQSPSS